MNRIFLPWLVLGLAICFASCQKADEFQEAVLEECQQVLAGDSEIARFGTRSKTDCIVGLGHIQDPRSGELLLQELNRNGDDFRRSRTIRAIGWLRYQPALGRLVDLARFHDSRDVREEAIQAIALFGEPRAIQALRGLYFSPNARDPLFALMTLTKTLDLPRKKFTPGPSCLDIRDVLELRTLESLQFCTAITQGDIAKARTFLLKMNSPALLEAHFFLKSAEPRKAIDTLNKVKTNHAEKGAIASFLLAKANYDALEFESASSLFRKFISQFPESDYIQYAMYLADPLDNAP